MELYKVAWKGNILVLLLAALSAGELDVKRAVLKASSKGCKEGIRKG